MFIKRQRTALTPHKTMPCVQIYRLTGTRGLYRRHCLRQFPPHGVLSQIQAARNSYFTSEEHYTYTDREKQIQRRCKEEYNSKQTNPNHVFRASIRIIS